ncbi:hypothetical protein, unknown function [Leishmania tarentolae]|uniref:Uncharacterized protein n=1 Tax=Leishmania tarentolae TaxID=5689 RepID=A0A640K7U4_LEITA|nr:hypothetical protein, unknown function [Leishmania tarentolae]
MYACELVNVRRRRHLALGCHEDDKGTAEMSLLCSTASPLPAEVSVDELRWDALAAECQRCSERLHRCKQEAERILQSMDCMLFCAALEATPLSVCGADHASSTPPLFR